MTREIFENSLKNPLDFWGTKTKFEVIELLGNEVGKMVGFDQRNPHHCYDLFLHTLHTVAGLPKDVETLLRVSAFFHDIGKTEVAMEKTDRLVFYGHAKKSAEIARNLLIEMNYSDTEVNEICFYIEHHDDFILWHLPEETDTIQSVYALAITEENVSAYQKRIGKLVTSCGVEKTMEDIFDNLLLLCAADISAQAVEVISQGIVCDSKKHKLEKNEKIREISKNIVEYV